MKIALLLYGQPRFFQYTYKHILEEYTIKNCETHIFAHFWKDIGFGPSDDETNTYYNIDNLEELLNNINTKKYLIEDYTNLDKALIYIKEQINKDHNGYKIGQHLSMEKCFNLIEQYQSEHNIKYDIVIKVRTDIIYKNKKFYNTHTEYENIKYNNYIKPFENFEKKTNNCLILPYTVHEIPEQLLNNSKYQEAKELINIHSNTDSKILQLLNKIKPENMYNFKHIYVAIGSDIYNIADYNTARMIYKDWVQKYINLYKKNSHLSKYKHFYRRLHTLYNFFLIEKKVNIHGTLCKNRYRRLVYSKSCKEKFIRCPKKKSIVINDFNQLNDEYIFNFK